MARQVIDDARAVSDAGAFSMVVEGVMEPVAREITNVVPVPTIGIGASAECDGQVLVSEDLLGLFSDFTPKFVKRYAELGNRYLPLLRPMPKMSAPAVSPLPSTASARRKPTVQRYDSSNPDRRLP